MRVIVVPYPWQGDVVGGHVTQQRETVHALRRLGIDADIAPVDQVAGRDADVVHAFEDVRPLLAAGGAHRPLVVTPIYFPRRFVLGAMPMYWRGDRKHRTGVWLKHRAHVLRHPRVRAARVSGLMARDDAWRQAQTIVVNSNAEESLLRKDVSRLPRVEVAHSGVAEEAFGGDAAHGRRLLGVGDEPFVLSVGRVEPIKNQVSLALAMRGIPARLVIVGSVLPGNERYLEAVREALPELVHVPHIDHGLLPHVHAAAAVHALPSWYETTGLSTLEALAVGTPVVVSRTTCVEEYFGAVARFCDAANVPSIRRALAAALEGPIGTEQDVARQFSWDRTAARLAEVYARVARG